MLWFKLCWLPLLGVLSLFLMPQAGPITVVLTPDCTVTSLRAAFEAANTNGAPDRIELPANCVYTFTDSASIAPQNNGPNALPVIENDHAAGLDLVINGNGATFRRDLAAPEFRLISVHTDTSVEINDLSISGGQTSYEGAGLHMLERGDLVLESLTFTQNTSTGANAEDGGGAVFIKNGTLHVANSTFIENSAGNGGAIKNLLTDLVLEDSTFISNTARLAENNTNGGGALFVDGANGERQRRILITRSLFQNNLTRYQGGALMLYVYGATSVDLEDSSFMGNQALQPVNGSGPFWGVGGGIWIGGGGTEYSYAIRRSTFANNLAINQGGGVYLQGAGAVSITNSTIHANQAAPDLISNQGLGGGIFLSNGSNMLTNVTVSENYAGGDGGGIFGGQATLKNTIIASNTANNGFDIKHNCAAGGFQADPAPYFADGGGNLQFPVLTNTFNNAPCTANILQADPLLGPLGHNGGPTQTRALQAGSPAINNGLACPALDQRGYVRLTCDTGAFGYNAAIFVATDHIYLPMIRRSN